MPHDDFRSDDPDLIEAQIERDRQALSDSMSRLHNRFSVDRLIEDATALVRDNAGPYTRAIDRAVRANPAALALTAAGLAWLLLGRRARPEEPAPTLAGTTFEAMSRWEDEGGPPPPGTTADDDWMAEAEALRDRANLTLKSLDRSVRDRAARAEDAAQDRAAVLVRLTDDVRGVMGRGLAQLSAEARSKVIAAREAAYAAHLDLRGRVGRMIEDHPLATGAVAAVAGAAVAVALPQTQAEHRVFGASRDRLMAEAQRLLAAERQRAEEVALSLADRLAEDADHATDHIARAAQDIAAGVTARH
ncbi:MAG: DUF3618 domain-containing protein [Gemmobacter sp.]